MDVRNKQKDILFCLSLIGKEIWVENAFQEVKSAEFDSDGARLRFNDLGVAYFVKWELLPNFTPKLRVVYVEIHNDEPLQIGDVVSVKSPFKEYTDTIVKLTESYAHTNSPRKYKILGNLSKGKITVKRLRMYVRS